MSDAHSSHPSSLAPESIFATDFQIVRPLSTGGMGSVYLVNQLSTGKQRALKLMLPQLVADEGLRRRFEQEARVGSLIESDHVVEVVGAGVDEASGNPWLVMELLKGEELAAFVESHGPSSVATVHAILKQLCHAVGAAHAASIVHRDLKPENVFLADSKRAGETWVVKVLDFGIAKIAAEAATRHTSAVGSPMWMAPEQTERGAVTPAADVWAIGLVTFFLLTGKRFWIAAEHDEATIHQIMREVLFDAIPTASSRAAHYGVAHTLPPWFDGWFARCVVRDVSVRFPNATSQLAGFDGHVGSSAATMHGPLPNSLSPTTPNPAITTPSAPPLARTELGTPAPPFVTPSAPPVYSGGQTQIDPTAASSMRPASAQARNLIGEDGGSSSSNKSTMLIVGLGVLAIALIGGGVFVYSRRNHDNTKHTANTTTAPTDTSNDDPNDPNIGPAPSLSVAHKAKLPGGHTTSTGPTLSAVLADGGGSVPTPSRPEGSFDRDRAVIAINSVETHSCANPGGPRGGGFVTVSFQPDGSVSDVHIQQERFANTAVGTCITQRFSALHVTPYKGGTERVSRQFFVGARTP